MRHSNIPGAEIVRFLREELPAYYSYTTNVTTYTDRNKVQQARIELKASIGVTRELSRYNPLNKTFTIKTENSTNSDF